MVFSQSQAGTYQTIGNNGGGVGGGGSTIVQVTPFVNIQISDPNKLAAALDAAQNVSAGLIKILDALALLTDATVIQWFNSTMTVAGLRSLIASTEWVITDQTFNNGGVGGAYRGQDGTTRDYLTYSSFVTGPNSYGNPNYAQLQGMVGILLHELGHMSSFGDPFTSASEGAYSRTHQGSMTGYVNSNHYANNEKYANDFMAAAAGVAQLSLVGYNPTWACGAISPARVTP